MGRMIGNNHSKPSRLAFGQRYAGLCPLWVKSGHEVNSFEAVVSALMLCPLLAKSGHKRLLPRRYSITLVARSRIDGGNVIPSALAVFKLTTNSSLMDR